MKKETNGSEHTEVSGDFRPWGENFPSWRAFKRYAIKRYSRDMNHTPVPTIKPDLTKVTAVDIARYWDIHWNHIIYADRPFKTPGDLHATIAYLYQMLRVMTDPVLLQRNPLLTEGFSIRSSGEIYSGHHRAAACILVGPKFIQQNELGNVLTPTMYP